MRCLSFATLLVGLFAGAFAIEAASAAPTLSLEEVIACMERNEPPETSIQTIEMRTRDRVGSERSIRAKIYGKRFEEGLRKLLMRFYEPEDLRGTGMLILEQKTRNDIFLYMPELGRTRRVSASSAAGSLFGTDLSYEDFVRIWNDDHKLVAVETQSTFAYVRNAVVRRLTPDGLDCDGIVEESFPIGALTDPKVFYDCSSDEELKQRVGRMIESVNRFLDLEPLESIPMSEYFLS